MSYLVSYENCPMIDTLCRRVLFLTRSHDVRHVRHHFDTHKVSVLDEAIAKAPWLRKPDYQRMERCRATISRLYGISPEQQRSCELIMSSYTLGSMLELPVSYPDDWLTFSTSCVDAPAQARDLRADLARFDLGLKFKGEESVEDTSYVHPEPRELLLSLEPAAKSLTRRAASDS